MSHIFHEVHLCGLLVNIQLWMVGIMEHKGRPRDEMDNDEIFRGRRAVCLNEELKKRTQLEFIVMTRKLLKNCTINIFVNHNFFLISI